MTVQNSAMAERFEEMADLLSIRGASPFRVRAYRNAARTIHGLSRSVAHMIDEGEDLSDLSGIGEDLAGKMVEMAEAGTFDDLEAARQAVPSGLVELLRVEGLGPKKVQKLRKELGIEDMDTLREAAEAGRIRGVPGFGKKSETEILQAVGQVPKQGRKLRRSVVETADELRAMLQDVDSVEDAVVAGSYRRGKETVGDLDIIVAADDAEPAMDAFCGYEEVSRVAERGGTRATVHLRSGLQVDLRVVEPDAFGAALLYFTGSKDHNIAVRRMAQEEGLKLSEYGLWKGTGGGEGGSSGGDGAKRIAGKTEEEIYDHFGLDWIPPELREERGELDAARGGTLPDLVKSSDLRGDLHMHTDQSDGRDDLETMLAAAEARGYDYIAVTDHSPNPAVAQGMDTEALRRRFKKIDDLNDDRDTGPRILKAAEVDIQEDGSLDYPDEALEEMDVVVCSVHSKMRLDRKEQTQRIVDAMSDEHAQILGHPSGRRIGRREGMDLDMEAILDAAEDEGWCFELDGQPDRLDLDDHWARAAKERGIPISISSDAHAASHLQQIECGVLQARRAWLEKEDVVNAGTLRQLRKRLKR